MIHPTGRLFPFALLGLVSISTIPEVDALFGRPPAYTRDQFVGIARLNAELVEDARKRPGAITYSSSGVYGASHVPMKMFLHAVGLELRHLPATGGAPAMTAVLGGHAAFWASPPAVTAPHLKAGKVRHVGRPAACRVWERDAQVLAGVIKRIGRIESR